MAREGQREALGDLLQGYRPYLLQIAHDELPAALHGKVGSSDTVQETILEALAGFARFQGSTLAELQAWLKTILHRQVGQFTHHYLRTQKRQADREVPVQDRPDDGQGTPSSLVGAAEMTTLVRQAMDRLPEHYRQVLVWREWEELPFAEIARRLERSEDAARMVWWRALERLNQVMNPSDEDSRE